MVDYTLLEKEILCTHVMSLREDKREFAESQLYVVLYRFLKSFLFCIVLL